MQHWIPRRQAYIDQIITLGRLCNIDGQSLGITSEKQILSIAIFEVGSLVQPSGGNNYCNCMDIVSRVANKSV
ncbi:hypothetical protein MTR67_001921 [Solanum verrucosum]|uniref:Uncharacterized protein n=1 Tax=Solanum verrucosum TaxID=315347 RepID=A0AAF0PQ20_SOLVR|nr:hypothetical protein MTR67_001921 [Solanum verrucosum]